MNRLKLDCVSLNLGRPNHVFRLGKYSDSASASLKNISLEIKSGDRVGIVGSNGAGKTSLLKVIAGIYPPTSGRTFIEGKPLSLLDISLGLNPDASVEKNTYVQARLFGLDHKDAKAVVSKAIDFAGLTGKEKHALKTLSSGMQLRLAFAVATSIEGDLVVMDEWLSVGDEKFVAKAEKRLLEFIDRSKILVVASHSRDLVQLLCNRLIWLDDGQIKMDGPVSEVSKAYFG